MSDTPIRTSTVTEPRAATDAREVALRVVAVVALFACALLFVDYVRPPVFCSDHHAGCDTVRHSAFAYLAGVPLPVLGTVYFTALLVAAGVSSALARRALAALGAVGVLSGVTFLAIQAVVLHAFCRYCVVVDTAAVVAGALAVSMYRAVPRPSVRINLVAAGAATLAFLLPFGYGMTRPEPARPQGPQQQAELPAPIQREIEDGHRAGKATIVEFLDFECPFCRRQHAALVPILASYGDRVRVVRRHVPLSFHPNARHAARVACCAEEQGKGDRVADALFHAEDLSAENCARIAREAGVDVATFNACLASRRPDAILDRDHDLARSVGVGGLPTFWIGRERFEGLQDEAVVRASLERAVRGARAGGGAADAAPARPGA